MATGHLDRRRRVRTSPQNSELPDRVPPHSMEAEINVLGSILLDPRVCDEVVMILRADDLYSDAHRTIFQHIVDMHNAGKQIDVVLLAQHLEEAGDLELVGGRSALAEIVEAVAVPAHATDYATIVRDKALLRSLIHAGTEIVQECFNSEKAPRELVGQAEEKVFAVNDTRSGDRVSSLHDVLVDTFNLIDHRMEHGVSSGINTGFKKLDEMTGGLHPAELVILAARPSMGKTAFATNIAEHVAVDAGEGVLFVSLEMACMELAQRMLCARGKINGHKFRGGSLKREDREALIRASAELSEAPFYIDDTPSRTVTEIAAVARRLKRRKKLGLIVIDYLQLIQPDNPSDPRQEQVAKIARRLKGLARELEVPILCLAQLNRQAEVTKDNRPRLSHLRESGAIEQDADVVMFIHREEYYHNKDDAEAKGLVGQAMVILSKQRNGPTGDVELVWLSDYTTFANPAAPGYDDFEAYSSPQPTDGMPPARF